MAVRCRPSRRPRTSERGRDARLAFVLALVLILLGAPLAAAVRPRFGGGATRGFIGAIRTLDPLAASSATELEAARQVHAGLYRFDAEGEPVPDLVERADVERDGFGVRFLLRRAWFHDGRPVTAEDARASLERFVQQSEIGKMLRGARPAPEPLVSIAGERELKLRVDAAPVLWPWLLASVAAAVLPGGGSEPGAGKVGAGPFRVGDLSSSGERLQLQAYDRHHRGRPLLDRLEYRAFADERALALAVRHQGVDVIDQPGADDAGTAGVAARPSVSQVVALRLNPRRAPLDAEAARATVAGAVRTELLIEVVLGGRAERAPGILKLRPLGREEGSGGGDGDGDGDGGPMAAPAPPPRGAAARSLVLVYPEGEGLKVVADRIRVDLHSAGFAVSPEAMAPPVLAAALAAGKFDLALVLLPGGDLPAPVRLAAVAGWLGREPPGSLIAAAASVQAGREIGSDLFAAESALLAGHELRPLFRRERQFLLRDTLHDLRVGPDGAAVFEGAWRFGARP